MLILLGLGLSLRLVLTPSGNVFIECSVGLGILVLLSIIYSRNRSDLQLLWDQEIGMLLSIKPWQIEVYCVRLFGSVPIGIDLKHSSARVLEAMAMHFKESSRMELRFVVTRPMSSSKTLVGMMIIARVPRILPGRRMITRVVKKVEVASFVLEGAMRSAYPHTPIIKSGLKETVLMINGGVDIDVECH